MPWPRMTWTSAAYVATVALCASLGFVHGSAWPILLAAAISVPASVVTLAGYHVLYGLISLIPGANPSSSSGSGSGDAGGQLLSTLTTAAPATWFTIATPVIGILALTVGALVNVQLMRVMSARRRRRVSDARL